MKNETDMFRYERELMSRGIYYIAGVDEAGRGPLAGPVAAAACIPCLDKPVAGVNDSKKLTPKKREELYEKIRETAVSYKVVMLDNQVIDEINILEATKRAMREALDGLFPIPEYVILDAVKFNDLPYPAMSIIHGDALSHSIAAASIMAKVERDRLMMKYAEQYPEYGFESHKGYGSKHHIEMILKYGPSPIHRMSFLKNILGDKNG